MKVDSNPDHCTTRRIRYEKVWRSNKVTSCHILAGDRDSHRMDERDLRVSDVETKRGE